jgi:hypothetical protein
MRFNVGDVVRLNVVGWNVIAIVVGFEDFDGTTLCEIIIQLDLSRAFVLESDLRPLGEE